MSACAMVASRESSDVQNDRHARFSFSPTCITFRAPFLDTVAGLGDRSMRWLLVCWLPNDPEFRYVARKHTLIPNTSKTNAHTVRHSTMALRLAQFHDQGTQSRGLGLRDRIVVAPRLLAASPNPRADTSFGYRPRPRLRSLNGTSEFRTRGAGRGCQTDSSRRKASQ